MVDLFDALPINDNSAGVNIVFIIVFFQWQPDLNKDRSVAR